jgi:DNA-binding transcriptional ArsR family regulator
MLLTADQTGLAVKATFFRGFGDPSRLKILEILRDGPLTVGEIVDASELSQSNVSNHLGCLRDCGLVTAEKQGRYVIYHLSDDRVGDLLALAESLLADVASGVYECTRYNLPREDFSR